MKKHTKTDSLYIFDRFMAFLLVICFLLIVGFAFSYLLVMAVLWFKFWVVPLAAVAALVYFLIRPLVDWVENTYFG